jgi:hypothetical protein
LHLFTMAQKYIKAQRNEGVVFAILTASIIKNLYRRTEATSLILAEIAMISGLDVTDFDVDRAIAGLSRRGVLCISRNSSADVRLYCLTDRFRLRELPAHFEVMPGLREALRGGERCLVMDK